MGQSKVRKVISDFSKILRISMSRCAISLTGDPITVGHRDVIKRAYSMFGHVVILLAADSSKKGALLDYADRKLLVEKALRDDGLVNFDIYPISGAIVDCAKKYEVDIIVRGLRNEQDLVYETDMSAINRILAPGIETVYLPCKPELSYVSSSAVRELARLGKFEAAAMFSSVEATMLMKLHLTKTVALTGGIACGKSVAQKVFERRGWLGIDCDELNRELLVDVEYCRLISEKCEELGYDGIWQNTYSGFKVNKKRLADAIFSSPAVKEAVEKISFPAIAEKLKAKLSDYSRGQPLRAVVQVPLLFDDAAEPFPFRFDRTVCILSNTADQLCRMHEARGYSREEADRRLASQTSPKSKAGKCDYVLHNDGTLEDFEMAVNNLAEKIENSI